MSDNECYSLLKVILLAQNDSQATRQTLLAYQEDAIVPLSNTFFAGVDDALGTLILQLMAEIGGFEAMATLMNVFVFETQRPVLQRIAVQGLWANQDNLSPKERADVEAFLANSIEL
jgi:hypothetical protein